MPDRGQTTRFIVPVALKEVMERLLPDFERRTGHRSDVTVMLNPEVPGYIADGASWDLAITNPWHVEEIIAAGHGERGSGRAFGRAPLAFGVRGDRAIVHESERGIARTLLEAESIAVTRTGTSGKTFRRLSRKLDIEHALAPKLRLMAGGEPMAALIAGDVDVAALPLTNIAPVRGVSPVAICPFALDVHIDLSSCTSPNASEAARTLARWLHDAALDEALERLGATRLPTR